MSQTGDTMELADRTSDTGTQPAAQKSSEEKTAAARQVRVLVVDDNRDAADLVGAILTALGHRVEVAYSAGSALEIAKRTQPDVAFIDLGMPGMDGCALALELRRDPALGAIRLVALTGWGAPTDRGRTREAGFDAHLVKPAGLEILGQTIAEVLSDPSGEQLS